MAYVRRRGNQLAIVHGERTDDGKVGQRVLVTLHSKAEALRIVNDAPETGAFHLFRQLVEQKYPHMTFNWPKIKTGIAENLRFLPDLHPYRKTRVEGTFRAGLVSFARELIISYPRDNLAAAHVVAQNRLELKFIADMINHHLSVQKPEPSPFNGDNEFYWSHALRGDDAPLGAGELAEDLYERGELDQAQAISRLLTESFPDYADGFNTLGLIALERGELDEALVNFRQTMEVGRRKFPKRISRKRYWHDHETRPYMRGMRNMVFTLVRLGRYGEALTWCDRLDKECADQDFSDWQRAMIFVNEGRWGEALAAAQRTGNGRLFEAIAALELKRPSAEALTQFVTAIVHAPSTVRKVFDLAVPPPDCHDSTEDWNNGIAARMGLAGYLSRRNASSRSYLKKILHHPLITDLFTECDTSRAALSLRGDLEERRLLITRDLDRKAPDFARQMAGKLASSPTTTDQF